MQALNQLVARSIVDPGVVHAFSVGRVGELLDDMDFSSELRHRLGALQAPTWAEFAVLAYRTVKAAETPVARVELPSPLEGLLADDAAQAEDERAA
jgi:hypothetical protein